MKNYIVSLGIKLDEQLTKDAKVINVPKKEAIQFYLFMLLKQIK